MPTVAPMLRSWNRRIAHGAVWWLQGVLLKRLADEKAGLAVLREALVVAEQNVFNACRLTAARLNGIFTGQLASVCAEVSRASPRLREQRLGELQTSFEKHFAKLGFTAEQDDAVKDLKVAYALVRVLLKDDIT